MYARYEGQAIDIPAGIEGWCSRSPRLPSDVNLCNYSKGKVRVGYINEVYRPFHVANSPREFFDLAKETPTLLQGLMPCLLNLQNPEAEDNSEALSKIIKLAAQHGFQFTLTELDEYFAEISGETFRAAMAGQIELSDSDLELVAGGKLGFDTRAVTVAQTSRLLC
jgi:hypothetical protein